MMSLFLANEPATGGGLSMILIFVAVIAIMYFLMIRPGKEKAEEGRSHAGRFEGRR